MIKAILLLFKSRNSPFAAARLMQEPYDEPWDRAVQLALQHHKITVTINPLRMHVGKIEVHTDVEFFGRPYRDIKGSGLVSGNTLLDLWRYVMQQELALEKENDQQREKTIMKQVFSDHELDFVRTFADE